MLPKRFVLLTLLLIGALIPFWISKPSLVGADIKAVSVEKSSLLASPPAALAGSGFFVESGQALDDSLTWAVALADADGDGDLDALSANDFGANKLWFNEGIGSEGLQFIDSGQSLGDSNSEALALGDLDGDDDLDMFVANAQNQANHVWLNDGTGSFSDSAHELGTSYSTAIALGDLDGNGSLDAFVGNWDGQANQVWFNDGTALFSDSGQSLGSSYTTSVALGDVDGDGDLDCLVGNTSISKLWLNDGTGTFSDSGQNLDQSNSRSVRLGDLDNDGDLDAFFGNQSNQANQVWLNNGSGLFTDSGQRLGYSSTHAVALGDFDGDSDLDAFVANHDNDNDEGQANTVWLNDGTGTFSHNQQSLGHETSRAVAIGDLDGDGDLDAYVGNAHEANTVWLNESDEQALSVVINEVAWAGTNASPDDEWIELYNNSLSDIDLSGWTLRISESLVISLTGVINAHDYYLLERSDDNTVSDIPADKIYSGELNDEGETLILYDSLAQVVDRANQDGGAWPAGNGEDALFGSQVEYSTMERIASLAPETNDHWATNDTIHQNGQDVDNQPLNGTPKEANSITYPESDDSCNSATEIEFDDNNQSSNYFDILRSHSDQDLFKFDVLDEYTTIKAQLTEPADFEFDLYFECDQNQLGQLNHIGRAGLIIGSGINTVLFNLGQQTGTYYLKINAPDDSYSGRPYRLNVVLQTINVSDVETLIFYNHMRFSDTHGLEAASQVMQQLTEFAEHPKVDGTIIQLDQYLAVQQAYDSWDSTPITPTLPNVQAANMVADIVHSIMIEHLDLEQFPSTEYIVLVGDDQQIPFRRLDINPFRTDPSWVYEHQYPFNSRNTPIGAALLADQTLTDNNYGSYLDYPYRNLPELAVGRLVGEPEDIQSMLDTFLEHDGQITLATGAVAGDDFLVDAAQSQCSLYEDAGVNMSCEMIGSDYTGAALSQAYLADQPELVSNNWHTSHQRLLAPGGGFLDAQSIFDGQVDLEGHLWSVMGCQSGLVMPNDSQYNMSLAQALSAQGVTYVGNTGWAWGSGDSIAFSERLYQLLTQRLVEENYIAIGEALRDAKRLYIEESSSADFSKAHYHEKVMTETTLFGLPMLRYQFPESTAAAISETSPITISRIITSHPDAVVSHSFGEPTELQIDPSLPANFHPLELSVGNLAHQAKVSERGTYYMGLGGATTAETGLPILPQQEPIDITTALGQGHGVIWLGGTYTISQSYDPVINTAATLNDPVGDEPDFEGLHPYLPLMISSLGSRDGTTSQRLVYITGQFDSHSEQLRLFTDVSVLIGLSSDSDIVPPTLGEPIANMGSNSLDLSIPISDTSGIYKAYLTYTEIESQSTTGAWQSIELTATQEDLYSQQITFTHPITYIIQVMDNAGNVATIPQEQSAALMGSITLQGRPALPNLDAMVPITVSLTTLDEAAPIKDFALLTDENGHFVIPSIPVGAYQVQLKKKTTLQNIQPVTLRGGQNDIDFGTLLEGDANDDNFVTIHDFSILAATFGQCQGTAGYDKRANFNGGDCINIIDFSLLASNFGQGGDTQATTPTRLRQPLNDVNMLIEPASTTVKPGAFFTVSLQLEANNQPVDGAQATLHFDPDLLEVVQMSAEEQILPQPLMKQFDNQRGTIQFAAGALDNFPTGTFDIVQVQFRALAAAEETTLAFQFDTPHKSNVTFGGTSVFGESADGVISIEDEATAVKVQSLAAPATPLPLWLLLLLGLMVAVGGWLRMKEGKNWS